METFLQKSKIKLFEGFEHLLKQVSIHLEICGVASMDAEPPNFFAIPGSGSDPGSRLRIRVRFRVRVRPL